MNYKIVKTNELYHHGIKGQHWGVRRFQNPDGSLTAAGKRKSKQYAKYSKAAVEEVVTQSNYVKAYNKAADKMNDGLIDKYNESYAKKHKNQNNEDLFDNEDYMKGFQKIFDDVFAKSYAQVLNEAYSQNKNYQKAQKLCEKYSMEKFDDLARDNAKAYEDIKKLLD